MCPGIEPQFGFPEEELDKIELGLEESVANVVEHAFEAGEAATFDITCEKIRLGMEIVIKDKGLPFDPSRLPDFHPTASDADKQDWDSSSPESHEQGLVP